MCHFSIALWLRRAVWRQVVGLAVLASAAQPLLAQQRFEFDATPGLLSKNVAPSRYQLALELDPARLAFSGEVQIALQVRKATGSVVLHAHELAASEVTLRAGEQRRSLRVVPDKSTQTWRLQPTDGAPIVAGQYTLAITYTGVVHKTGEGLFVAPYSVNGVPARMLATQLQAITARTVFPSFDEPVFRAVFELTVRAPKSQQVFSNTPVIQAADDPSREGWQVHRFQPTPPMPSYLFAVAVGRMEAIDDEVAGVPLRVITAEGKGEQARYALQVTRQVLPHYNAYFGLPYALPKLDQLAVPAVRSGAMEDWGLISYSEPTILFDPKRSSPRTQRRVFSVMAHEIAHQWFGNLVTAASWEEIWLNEAFATWMAARATDHFNPAWQEPLRERFPMDRAMVKDATAATRAIRSGAVSERAVFDVFDDITYEKGGAVLRMLEQWIGPEDFRKGLQAYMVSQKYSSATAADLWHHIGQAAGRDVQAVAASWTDQRGFPMVSLESACEGGQTIVRLRQQRFTYAPMLAKPAPLWRIPVRVSRGDEVTTVLLDDAQASVALPGCAMQPLLANAGGAGFYRVRYTPQALSRLTSQFLELSATDRVTLLSDTFAHVQAGNVPMAAYFGLVARVPEVGDASRAALFSLTAESFRFFDVTMAGTPAQGAVRAAARQLFGPELERLGWESQPDEDPELTALRDELIALLARFDDQAVVSRANQLFDLDQAGHAPLPAAIRQGVVRAVGQHSNAVRFDQLLAHLKAAEGEEDRWLYAGALAAGRHAGRADRTLALSLQASTTTNIASRIPGMVSDGSPFAAKAYGFALRHWRALSQRAGGFGGRYWVLPGAADGLNDAVSAQRLRKDQARLAGADGSAPAAEIAAQIDVRAAVRRREAARLAATLAGWRPAGSP